MGKGKCLRMSCEWEMSVWSMEMSANLLLLICSHEGLDQSDL